MNIKLEQTQYHRFSLYYDFDRDVVAFCRIIQESFGWRNFCFKAEGKLKRWIFSNVDIALAFQAKYPHCTIEAPAMRVIEKESVALQAAKQNEIFVNMIKEKENTTFDVPGLKMDLYPYQRIGVEFMEASGGRAINADSMGLGKSAQAIAYIKHRDLGRVLIVSPASVKFVWFNEISKWTNMKRVMIDSKTDLSTIGPEVRCWIINYDVLRKHHAQLSKIHFDAIIGDEAQYIKSINAIRTRAFRSLSRNVNQVLLLSGTPLLSRPAELYSLLNIIDPGTWNNWYDFARRYCDAHQTRFGWDTTGTSHEDELHNKIKKYFIRRKKEEVLKELPPKVFVDVPVKLSPDVSKEYSEASSNFAMYLRQHSGKQPAEIAKTMQAEKLARLNALRQLNARGKVDTAIEMVENIIESGEKVIVFSSFNEPIERLQKHFGGKCVVVTGKTPMADRQLAVEAFQTDKNVRIFLGGIKSAGVGLTLTAASAVMFVDFSWNPADMQQAQDRACRIGQTAKHVMIYQLFAMDTIDEDMKDTLDFKQMVFDQIIEGKSGEAIAKKAMDQALSRVLQDDKETKPWKGF